MRQKLIRLAFPFGRTRRVLYGPLRGMRFVVNNGMAFSYALGRKSAAPRHYARWVRPGMTVYDVGANQGQMTLLFAHLVGPAGRVVSVEPVPDMFELLVRNVEMNGLDHVRTIQAAAAAERGEVTLQYHPEAPTQAKVIGVEAAYTPRSAGTLTVPSLALDDLLLKERPPDFVKIDVEGAAAVVLRGARQIIKEYGPPMYVEIHGPEEKAAVRDELLTRGYVAETLSGLRVPDPTEVARAAFWCYRPR